MTLHAERFGRRGWRQAETSLLAGRVRQSRTRFDPRRERQEPSPQAPKPHATRRQARRGRGRLRSPPPRRRREPRSALLPPIRSTPTPNGNGNAKGANGDTDGRCPHRYTDAEFIADCYRVFLGRDPSERELSEWLQGAWNRAQVMTVFSESEEFANRIAPPGARTQR